MERHPALTSNTPWCFGLHHNPDSAKCTACPFKAECTTMCQHWIDRRSIAQEEAAAVATVPEDTDPEAMLMAIVKDHIGRPPRFRSGKERTSIRLGLLIVKAELAAKDPPEDLSHWIAAQVGCMKARLKRNAMILPGHLLGPEADRRYRAFVRQLNRNYVDETLRLRRDRAVSIDDVSFEVADFLRVCYLDGMDPLLHDERAKLSPAAKRVITSPDRPFERSCALRATADFLHQLHPGLQHRLTAPTSWNWSALIVSLLRLFPLHESDTPLCPSLEA